MMGLFKSIFKSYSEREVKRIEPIANKVLALDEEMGKLTDEQLQAKTPEFKERLAKGETLDDILVEAFAVVREASWRKLHMKHHKVQIIGGIVLHQGRIAELKTGEGKTLVATLPAYLNGLTGNGVHIVTVNDYLARRDSEWMGKLYRYLGLTVGLIVHDMDPADRKEAYNADITYGTNNELGFDYLRDNMVVYKENKVQRGHSFAIVDEVDSILIDEARTPLIISGKGDKSTDLNTQADRFAKTLKVQRFTELNSKEDMEDYYIENGIDYVVDEKQKTATLTQSGVKKAEAFFNLENLSDPENLSYQHHVNQAIRANGIMKRDVDYVVNDGEIIIVDEFTGRLMYGRRYNEGLHQAIEAKEGVKVQNESKTLATITFQNYFRLYNKLSGMTGTAQTEATEFQEIYKLDVVEIPTNKPLARVDLPDAIFRTENGKFMAVIQQIVEAHEKGQPVLVGTISIEKSELLSKMLKKRGIKHNVLNAKQHDKEAEIIAQAGKLGAVTIATNMAGRGTDITLGGNAEFLAKASMRKQGFPEELIVEATGFAETDDEEILEARKTFAELNEKYSQEIKEEADKVREVGGLFIMGTERHDSRRIDNQLRGRAGRQGDPGKSQFYLSTEDDLMRLFGGDRMKMMLSRMNVDEDMPIESKALSNIIESSQEKVEMRNFGIRKDVLQYDDVLNKQREIIYKQRDQVLDGENLHDTVVKMIEESITENVNRFLPEGIHDNWNITGLLDTYKDWVVKDRSKYSYTDDELEILEQDEIKNMLIEDAMAVYEENEKLLPEEVIREVERVYMLQCVDTYWMDHIDNMEQLKAGIHLRSYGQHDPVVEYRLEGFDMFDHMIASIREDTAKLVLTQPKRIYEQQRRKEAILAAKRLAAQKAATSSENDEDSDEDITPTLQRKQVAQPTATSGDGTDTANKTVRKGKKVGRNDPCPCGSGKKYKKCCGRDQ
ncbi:MAG: preprotein translocase subunit SecA [Oscillospiraceae bacterium]|nr:preprotein translocase subunit SecA [Oscillospiraceae bacterium]